MLISQEEAEKRLNSPQNLLNRLRSSNGKSSSMQLFGVGVKESTKESAKVDTFTSPFEAEKPKSLVNLAKEAIKEIPKVEESGDLNAREKLEAIQHKAIDTLMLAINETRSKLGDLNATKSAEVAAKMGKIVDSIRSEKHRSRSEDKQVHLHFYTPEPKKVEEFEVIDV